MRTIQASVFKTHCLTLMDEVATSGESLLITKHGKPVAELKAHRPPPVKSLIGLHKDQIKILGDIISPAYDGEWNALK
ncbi:type II toxin-antitoxin system Phd/YefM family antitoxin [Panacagrimonas sp.]|uniref:type II toxin-antitoxin system Phd/YefM family antitoxin n=1 Tax=Panacagrimonas sp. TaxID=2480088 RepID=UPI003B5209FA